MPRNRRDREHATCPTCHKTVTVRRDGDLMAHRDPEGRTCVDAAWKRHRDMLADPTECDPNGTPPMF